LLIEEIKLVVFDLDGTLIDAFQDIAQAANFIRDRNGLSTMTVNEVKKFVGHGARYLVEGILGSDDKDLIDENHSALVVYYTGLTETTATVYPGAVELLNWLQSQGILTAVASNKPHSVTLKVVAKLGLAPALDMVQGEGNGIARKPAPEVLLHIAERAGITPQQMIMVGDTDVDIDCARAAQCQVAAVTHGQYDRAYLEKHHPDWLLDSLSELRAILS
jgi:phosphoglycolate phosphatase